MVVLGLELPRGRRLTGSVLFGLLQFAATFGLAYYALVELHAGFAGIILALVPLLTLLLAVAQRQERLHLTAVVGTVLALAGIAVMSRAPLEASLPALSILAAFGAALCFAQAAVLVRHLPPVHPVTMNAVGMTAGAAVLLACSLLVGESPELPGQAATWAAVGYLVTAGSLAVFLLYLFVLRRWAASRAAYAFVLTPVVTIVLSRWIDDEPVGIGLVLGGFLVLTGVYVGALRSRTEVAANP
jgi:drug/metabolite transporter (DMT)-like permease